MLASFVIRGGREGGNGAMKVGGCAGAVTRGGRGASGVAVVFIFFFLTFEKDAVATLSSRSLGVRSSC